MSNTADSGKRDDSQKDVYGIGYSSEDTHRLALRRAATHAAFFLPHLEAGMSLLDCGCGPGTITVDLAETVSPGEAVGIDPEAKQIKAAQSYASERGIANVRFQIASVHELPFQDESFDAVFMHAVCDHISDVPKAFGEIRRVLKKGGVLGVRSGDIEASMVWPDDPTLKLVWELFERVYLRHDRELYFGRRQFAMLRNAGFTKIKVSASCDCWSETPESKIAHAKLCEQICSDSWAAEQAIALGIADKETLANIADAWRAWADNPDAFMAEARAEAVAWNE